MEGFLYVIDDRAKETTFWSAGFREESRNFWSFEQTTLASLSGPLFVCDSLKSILIKR